MSLQMNGHDQRSMCPTCKGTEGQRDLCQHSWYRWGPNHCNISSKGCVRLGINWDCCFDKTNNPNKNPLLSRGLKRKTCGVENCRDASGN